MNMDTEECNVGKSRSYLFFRTFVWGGKKNETDLQGDSAKEGVVGKKRELFIR